MSGLKLSFIGYGHMAKALAASFSRDPKLVLRAASPSQTIGVDAYGVATNPSNAAVIKDAETIVLAVKPQKMQELLAEIKALIPKNCLIVSIATGLSLSWFATQGLSQHAIVRCMPNLGVLVQKGATPLIGNQLVSQKHREILTELFAKTGLCTWLSQESEMEVFTALSGSGPAYHFLFWEAMVSLAEQLGLSKETARAFTLQTALGAVCLAQESPLLLEELRAKVTSEKGTTAAALDVFQAQGFVDLVQQAIRAAHERAIALGC